MTKAIVERKNKRWYTKFAPIVCILLCATMVMKSSVMKDGAIQGMDIAFKTVVPTLFPFFILSDLWSCYFQIDEGAFALKIFEGILKIPSCAISAFLAGNVCGFPLGVKMANDLYCNRKISKDQATLLCGISNNPSAAFVISGVGQGLFHSSRIGVLLYFCCIITSLLCSVIYKQKYENDAKPQNNSEQTFNLVSSIKAAGLNSITISSFIIFFSALISLLKSIIRNPLIIATFSSFFEVSNATTLITNITYLPIKIKTALVAFSLGFSGFSVHFQAFSLMSNELSKTKYLSIKFTQGLLCGLLSFLLIK